MQEGDVQIKGYPVRLPLDIMLVFTANPEDYTARGKIITPLKDRIGSEIRTHYPLTVEQGLSITKQESWVERESPIRLEVPTYIARSSSSWRSWRAKTSAWTSALAFPNGCRSLRWRTSFRMPSGAP
jgi:Mg-chelatase subunit ChlI